MLDEEFCRKKADELLKAAAMTDNMKMRGVLIDEASRWHWMAIEAREGLKAPANDDGNQALA